MELLNEKLINSLGQLYLLKYGDKDTWWPLQTICIETGCLHYDVIGMIERGHIGDVKMFKDDNGTLYEPDDFYLGEKNDG